MDSRELMIGNYLIAEGHYVEVNEIYDHGIHAFNGENEENHSYDHLRPIPLTEDILIRCGFEKKMDIVFDRPYFVWEDRQLLLFDVNNSEWLFDRIGLPNAPQSLHQLQNLIFALTKQKITLI